MLNPFVFAAETESTEPKKITLYSELKSFEIGINVGHSQANTIFENKKNKNRIFFFIQELIDYAKLRIKNKTN